MYFRSHVYLAREITGSTNPYLLVGSLFPDFFVTKILDQGFDRRVIEYMSFVKEKYPSLLPFAIGWCLHEHPIGVDRFIHTSYDGKEGFAFQFVDELIADARALFDEDVAILMTHFFVENAIEYHILQSHPEVEQELRDAWERIDKDMVAKSLAEFYGGRSAAYRQGLDQYAHHIFDFDFSTFFGQGEAWADTMKFVFGKTVDPHPIAAAIEKTYNIIEEKIESFLADVMHQCKEEYVFNFSKIGI